MGIERRKKSHFPVTAELQWQSRVSRGEQQGSFKWCSSPCVRRSLSWGSVSLSVTWKRRFNARCSLSESILSVGHISAAKLLYCTGRVTSKPDVGLHQKRRDIWSHGNDRDGNPLSSGGGRWGGHPNTIEQINWLIGLLLELCTRDTQGVLGGFQ